MKVLPTTSCRWTKISARHSVMQIAMLSGAILGPVIYTQKCYIEDFCFQINAMVTAFKTFLFSCNSVTVRKTMPFRGMERMLWLHIYDLQ